MPYVRTGGKVGRPPKPTPIVPAVPAVTPDQGTLQETIMLGDAASVTANPATKLRWFATRAEIQIRIQNDEIGRAKAEASAATTKAEELTTANAALVEQSRILTAKLSDVESTHQRQLESERRRTEEAVERANVSYEKIKELEPDAQHWRKLQSPDASILGELSKQEIKQHTIKEIEQELWHYDQDRELRPSGMWKQSILSPVESKEYLAHERDLRRKLLLLTESPEGREKRLKSEAIEKENENNWKLIHLNGNINLTKMIKRSDPFNTLGIKFMSRRLNEKSAY